ncbi:hypothetical protein BC835DRAFT_1342447 [Cytidiella melzeri]|nr:hypothetical protein BC835DRAFT_1342447 [Cytidiella melzeri]
MSAVTEIDSCANENIKSITVYMSGKAEVVRTYQLNLNDGDNEIRVAGLSSHMDHQSVRVSGLGSVARLVDVICTTKATDFFKPSELLRLLQAKKQKLEAERLILRQETEIYQSYAKSITSEHVTTDKLVPFMQTLVQERRGILEAITSLDEQIHGVDEEIAQHSVKGQASQSAGRVTLHVYVDPALRPVVTLRSLESVEPDEQWKKGVKDDIDAQYAPDIALLMDDYECKRSAPGLTLAGSQRIDLEYNAQMQQYMSLASQKYEERLEAERHRRKNSSQQQPGATTTFTLSYVVSNALWKPLYDIHAMGQAEGGTPSVVLHYRASITQQTGEDWLNAPLVLSTASDAVHSAEIPQLPVYRIQPVANLFQTTKGGAVFKQAQPNDTILFGQSPLFGQSHGAGRAVVPSAFSGAFGSQPFAAAPTVETQAFHQFPAGASAFGGLTQAQPYDQNLSGQNPLFGQPNGAGQAVAPSAFLGPFGSQSPAGADQEERYLAEQPEPMNTSSGDNTVASAITLRTNSVSVSYAVSHPVKIPSDGAAHTVSVATLRLDAQISHVCVPRVEPMVYLYCKVNNKSEYQLVAGPVNVFLDDAFIGRTSLKNIMPNESFECTLGADSALRVTYERLPGKEQQLSDTGHANLFGERKNVRKQVVRTYITNNHPFSIDSLIVRDALPLAVFDIIKVTLKKPEGLAEAKAEEEIKVSDNIKVRWSGTTDKSEGIEGRYEWLVSLDAGKGCTLETEWEVQAPINTSWKEVTEAN